MELFNEMPPTSDPLITHCMLGVARNLHDSVDPLAPEGEAQSIASLFQKFIGNVDYGKDFESQLAFFVECRAAFHRLPSIFRALVLKVASLAMRTLILMGGKHSKKTAPFVKACLAYCHITIPSIRCSCDRMTLLTHCAEVALRNQCLPQTDAFLKAAISLLPELPSPSSETDAEERVADMLRPLLSLLLVVPGHPEIGPFYLVQGLLGAMPLYPWSANSIIRVRLYIDVLKLLHAMSQSVFLYRIPMVQSNDELYGNTSEYTHALMVHFQAVLEETLRLLEQSSQPLLANEDGSNFAFLRKLNAQQLSQWSRTAGDLAALLVDVSRIDSAPSSNTITKLLKISHRSAYASADKEYLQSLLHSVLHVIRENPSSVSDSLMQRIADMCAI